MRRRIIIWGIVIGVVLLGGLGIYLALRGGESTTYTSDSASLGFDPQNPAAKAYVAFTDGTTAAGKTYSSAIVSDGRGKKKTTTTINGQITTTYVGNGRYLICPGGTSCRQATAEETNANNPYAASSEKITEWKKAVSYQGTAPCDTASGSCNVWKVKAGATESELLTNVNNVIIQLKTSADGGTFTTNYTYKPIAVTIPNTQ